MDKKAYAKALAAAEELVKLCDGDDQELARELRNRLSLPMGVVIAKIPGDNLRQKAITAGVSRQTLYTWDRNETRPAPKQAAKLAKLTGLSADRIVGRKQR